MRLKMRKISRVTIAFENFETFVIKGKDIAHLEFRGLKRTGIMWIKNMPSVVSATCNLCTLSILKRANTRYVSVDGRKLTLFTRIMEHPDVVRVTVAFEQGPSLAVELPYLGDETNAYQSVNRFDKNITLIISGKEN